MRFFAGIALAVTTPGCVSTQIDETTPSIETLKLLRARDIAPVSLGTFTDVRDGAGSGRSINIRGSTLHAAKGKRFVDFLKDTMATELKASAKLDPNSPITISAALNESRAGENLSSGGASLGAKFSISRSGVAAFSKQYRVDTKWESDFLGAIAIPEAFRQYNALYALLVREAFADPEFVAALRK